MEQIDGPWMRAKLWAKLSGSALRMKLMSPWRYSVTFFERWRATATKPMRSNSAASFRSEEHTSELQSLMRNSYAVFCLKKKNNTHTIYRIQIHTKIENHREKKYNIQ